MQHVQGVNEGPYFVIACSGQGETQVLVLQHNTTANTLNQQLELTLPLAEVFNLFSFVRNSKEFYVALVDQLQQDDIDAFSSNRILVYQLAVYSSGVQVDSQLLYASYEQDMAILDFVYEQDLDLFFLADNEGQIRALGNVENFIYDTTSWKLPQEAGNTRKVLANSIVISGEKGEVLEMTVLTGVGDLLKLHIDTKRIYDQDGYKWEKISNNLNNADHVYEDFSNN